MDTRWPSARILPCQGRDGGCSHLLGFPPVSVLASSTLLEVMASEQPEAMAIAFDLGLPTFRHEADDTYKTDRPEDFSRSKNLHELLKGFNFQLSRLQVTRQMMFWELWHKGSAGV